MDIEKSENRSAALKDQSMKKISIEELLKDINGLSESEKIQVTAYIRSLKKEPDASLVLTPSEVAKFEATSERLCAAAKDLPEFDVLELMEDMRR